MAVTGVQISRKVSNAVYCNNCGEYRIAVIVDLKLNDSGHIQEKNYKQCSDCKSSNIRDIEKPKSQRNESVEVN